MYNSAVYPYPPQQYNPNYLVGWMHNSTQGYNHLVSVVQGQGEELARQNGKLNEQEEWLAMQNEEIADQTATMKRQEEGMAEMGKRMVEMSNRLSACQGHIAGMDERQVVYERAALIVSMQFGVIRV